MPEATPSATAADDVELVPIVVPASAAEAATGDFATMIEIRNAVGEVVLGDRHLAITPAEALPAWLDQADEEILGFLVRAGGEAVGRALVYAPREAGAKTATIRIEIRPDRWGRGVGRAIYPRLEQLVRDRGRTVVHGWTDHPSSDEARLPARTGWGSVPTDHQTRFLTASGFALGQVYRTSAFDLAGPVDQVERLLVEARAAASDYRYLSWPLPTPPEHLDDMAVLKARMSTDAPVGDTQWDEEEWEADRVARMDRRLIEQGFTGLVGAAQHVESGRLAAFTELYFHGDDPTAPTAQNDTLVLKDHRGHRLGMLVKGETLLRWRELHPQSSRIYTNNAEENRPMLDINEAMGFVPVTFGGSWEKTLA